MLIKMESNKFDINWQLICRICLETSNSDMKCIYEEHANDDDVVSKIIKCGGVPVDIMDGMPDRICHKCLAQLNIASSFRNTCQDSYYQLLKFLQAREQPKNVKEEQDCFADLIKMETVYTDSKLSAEDLCVEEPLDDNSTHEDAAEDSMENEDVQDLADELLIEPIKVESMSKYDEEKSTRSRSNKMINEDPGKMPKKRGRKPNLKGKYICHICGNIYPIQGRLSQHLKSHEEKEHPCEICGKKFMNTGQIARHMNTHTGNRPYKCKYCTASFGDTSTRNKHERIHTNERPFKCLECGKAFSYSNVLKVHMSIHTGERPFSCSICGKRFSQKHHQQSHEKTHSNFGRSGKSQ